MQEKQSFNFWYTAIAVLCVLVLRSWWVNSSQVETISYSEFLEFLAEDRVEEIAIGEGQIRGTLRHPLPDGRKLIVTTRVDPALAQDLSSYNVKFSGVIESHLLSNLLSWILPALVFVGVWMFLMKRMTERQGGLGGFMSVGKSKAKIFVESDTGVRLEDVAGVDEAKVELEEVINFLKEPERFGQLGAHVPKGILLLGPPGTGKTLLARAVAGEAGVPFFSISGSEFVEMFVGVGAARVRDLFEQARQKAPCIVFIDELDALGRARGISPLGGGHDEKEQTLNQLLVEMDGFDPSARVILLAATNRPEILDPALLRPGRFDRQVLLDRPDKIGRVDILKVHMKRIRAAKDADPEQIAALTPGFTGADLANLVNEAAMLATRREAQAVTLKDFTAAVERIVAGLEKRNRLLNPQERRTVAYHEMGHALVASSLPGADKVHKISIIPRGIGSLGYTIQRPTEDRYLMTRQELRNKMAVLLGGRAAERLVFDDISTGAADDLAKATDIARSMVTEYGMDEGLGQMSYELRDNVFLQGQHFAQAPVKRYSEETAHDIDRAVRAILDAAGERALNILEQNREALERGATLLLEKETLSGDELPMLTEDADTAPEVACV